MDFEFLRFLLFFATGLCVYLLGYWQGNSAGQRRQIRRVEEALSRMQKKAPPIRLVKLH